MCATLVQDGIGSLDHSFLVAGDPGQGNRSGAAYFSQSSDEKRGGLTLDDCFIKAAQKKKTSKDEPVFSKEALSALQNMEPRKYQSKEDFFFAYAQECQNLRRDISLKDVLGEYIKLTFLGAQEDMEVWLREGNGAEATRPNLAERDRRRFEGRWQNVGPKETRSEKETRLKEFGPLSELRKKSIEEQLAEGPIALKNITLRRLEVDPSALIETKRSLMLKRLYVDELHNRMGTLVPASLYELGNADQMSKIKLTDIDLEKYRTYREIDADTGTEARPGVDVNDLLGPDERRKIATDRTATYQYAPQKYGEGNCNTGVGDFLELAGVPRENALAATAFQIGLHHEGMHQWNPLRGNATSSAAQPPSAEDKKQEMIDTTSIRTGNINMDGIEAVLKRKAADIKTLASMRSKL
jgi:hypothetical protein